MFGLRVHISEELLLGSETARRERLGRVTREAILHKNDLVQVIFKVVSASIASMPIINGEVTALGPVLGDCLVCWLAHVQDDAHSVFVVVALDALVRVRCVTSYYSVRARRILRLLEVAQGVRRLQIRDRVGRSSRVEVRTAGGREHPTPHTRIVISRRQVLRIRWLIARLKLDGGATIIFAFDGGALSRKFILRVPNRFKFV